MGLRLWGFGLRVQDFEFRAWGLGFGVWGFGLMVRDLEFGACGLQLGCGVKGTKV